MKQLHNVSLIIFNALVGSYESEFKQFTMREGSVASLTLENPETVVNEATLTGLWSNGQ